MTQPSYDWWICLNGHFDRDWRWHTESPKQCLKCGERVVTRCNHCNEKIGPIFWGYAPDEFNRFYRTAQPNRDYCYKCGRTHQWAERWLYKLRKSASPAGVLTDYEFELVWRDDDFDEMSAWGLEVRDLVAPLITRPLLNKLFGPTVGAVSIENPRHPKHALWRQFRVDQAEVVQLVRADIALEEAEERQKLAFWFGLSGQQFERELGGLLQRKGFDVIHAGGPGDLGADLIIRTAEGRVIVQCKAHAARIGPGPVRDLLGSLVHHAAKEAWLVSLVGYSTAARRFAHGKNIKLLTIEEFLE